MAAGDEGCTIVVCKATNGVARMRKNDLSRSLVAFDQDSTLIAVIELSLSKWLVAGVVPGVERSPLKALGPDPEALLKLIHRWRDEAVKAGKVVRRMVVAYEAGRDGFWLARWLRSRGIEAYVIHPTSIPVSREHRRAKSDRIDVRLLFRAVLGWLRGEAEHCSMVAIPSLEEEDARRPTREHEMLVGERTSIINRVKAAMIRLGIRGFNPKLRKAAEQLTSLRSPEGQPLPPHTLAEVQRDLARLALVRAQLQEIEKQRAQRLQKAPKEGTHPMVLMLAKIMGIGVETADMLVHEVLTRDLRDERAVGRYAGLTGSPDESGSKRREKGLAKAGNGRVRRSMVELAWRWLMYQKGSALAQWFVDKTASGQRGARQKFIVALARKLLIALWRYVRFGEVPVGVVLKAEPAR